MDAGLLTTYDATLKALILRCNLTVAGAKDADKELMAAALSEAMDWAWKEPMEPWPPLIEGATVTLTGGKIAWADIFHASWWEVYDKDPRPSLASGDTGAQRVETRHDADGLWPDTSGLWPGQTPSTLFVLFLRRAPEFTVEAVNTGSSYNAGSVVWSKSSTFGGSGTGNCYRALEDSAPGNDLADAKWELQQVPRFLTQALLPAAQAGWLRTKSKEDKAAVFDAQATQNLEAEWFKQKGRG